MDGFLDHIIDSLSNLWGHTAHHDISDLAEALSNAGVDIHSLTSDQIHQMVHHLDSVIATNTAAADSALQVGLHQPHFGSHEWVQWPSGTLYERVNGQYTGNHS
jgi:hypothetical protein